jgi:hypothetical protein
MRLAKDFREFIELLNSNHVEYVIVGGYALAFHGAPRYTGDIDILVRCSAANAAALETALTVFGFASLGITARDFQEPGQVVQLGFPPHRIDILSGISGVSFDTVWQRRVRADLDGTPVNFIDRESFIRNKKATGRTKDKADVETLGAE